MNDVEAVRRCAAIAFRQAKAHEAASEKPISAEYREMSVHMSLAASAVGQAIMAQLNQSGAREQSGDIVEMMRLLEVDHGPDGWPAVRMRDISALCDEIERLRKQVSE